MEHLQPTQPLTPLSFAGSAEPYVRAEPLALLFDVSPCTPLHWARLGAPHLKLPGGTRFRISEIEVWLKTPDVAKPSNGHQPS
jgi:hypothetical protein